MYGEVNKRNFPEVSDYRNIIIAEAMKVLGYVNKFNMGIVRATELLIENGNGEPEFDIDLETKFRVVVRVADRW